MSGVGFIQVAKVIVECKCKYHIIHSPQGFSGIIYNTWLGDFARLLQEQFTISNEGMSNDAPIHE